MNSQPLQNADAITPIEQGVRKAFSLAAKHYDNHAHIQRQAAGDLLRLCDEHLLKSKRVLDIGSGTGILSKLSNQQHALWINIDISAAMLRQGQCQQYQSRKIDICADANALPLDDYSVDMVVSNMALQWCQHPTACLKEIYRVLVHSGRATLGILVDESFAALKHAWSNTGYAPKLAKLPTRAEWLKVANTLFDVTAQSITYEDEAESINALLKRMQQVGAGYSQHSCRDDLQERFSVAEAKAIQSSWQKHYGKRFFLEYQVLQLQLIKR